MHESDDRGALDQSGSEGTTAPSTLPSPDDVENAFLPPGEADQIETGSEPADGPVVEQAKTKRLGPLGWIAIVWMVVVTAMTIVPGAFPVPELTERFPDQLRADDLGPQAGHVFGLDGAGRDMAAKVVYGTRASMIVSVAAVLFGLVVGGFFGLIAGYFRGRIDTFLVNAFNIMLSFPQLVLALTLATIFATGDNISYARRVTVVTLAIGIVSVPILGRVTRANTLAWSEREFVSAAKAMGARNSRIIWREVLPNVLPAMFSITLLGIAVAIVVEGGLALIGVGIPADINSPSWGNLIATGRSQMLLGSPHLVLGPSLMIFLTVMSLNYLGDVVRARFDVRESVL